MARSKTRTNIKDKAIDGQSQFSASDSVKKIGGYVSLVIGIFSAGFFTGQYISDLKSTENSIKVQGEFQKEREQMKDERDKIKEELMLYKFSNPNYATKEELEQLKMNLDKFTKRQKQ